MYLQLFVYEDSVLDFAVCRLISGIHWCAVQTDAQSSLKLLLSYINCFGSICAFRFTYLLTYLPKWYLKPVSGSQVIATIHNVKCTTDPCVYQPQCRHKNHENYGLYLSIRLLKPVMLKINRCHTKHLPNNSPVIIVIISIRSSSPPVDMISFGYVTQQNRYFAKAAFHGV